LRRAARVMQQTLAELKVRTHPDKTFLGRTARGFDFLGYRFGADGLTRVAARTLERFRAKAKRLAAQDEADGKAVEPLLVGAEPFAAGTADDEALPSAETTTAGPRAEPAAPFRGGNGTTPERDSRLCEQAAAASPSGPPGLRGLAGRCGDYVRRWCR